MRAALLCRAEGNEDPVLGAVSCKREGGGVQLGPQWLWGWSRGWKQGVGTGRKHYHVISHKLLSWIPLGLGAILPRALGAGRCCSCTSHGVHPPHQPLFPQMAQRLALQRLLSLPARGPLASHGRAFGTSAGRRSTFNVQDGSDFQDRVVNSPKPVVVDFHAQ